MQNFAGARADADRKLGQQQAAFTHSRRLAQRRGDRQRADFTQNFKRQLPGFQGQFAGRNMGNSGFYKNALQQQTTDFTQGLGRMVQDQNDQLAGMDMENANYRAEYDSYMRQLAEQEAQSIASTAQHIELLRPWLGGY